jgi:hypothetical protein
MFEIYSFQRKLIITTMVILSEACVTLANLCYSV